jgi:DNA polymerase-3 subunit epsilon
LYCIVDIETTGGNATSARIIEIAIVKFDGIDVVSTYSTLINPRSKVPPFISKLTGISDKMLIDKSFFEDVADDILEFTEDCCFVSHPIKMDYEFVQKEFSRIGLSFERETLCTMQLTKKFFSNLDHYSLKSLCEKFDIKNHYPHRALGDAMATTELLKYIIKINPTLQLIDYSELNDKLDLKIFRKLPKKSGVYFFHDEEGKIILSGKTNNILNRVVFHFQNKSSRKYQTISTQTVNITYEITGSKLISILKLYQSRNINNNQPESEKCVFENDNFVIIEDGRTEDELSVLLVKNNEYVGYGWIPKNDIKFDMKTIESYISNRRVLPYENKIVFNYLKSEKSLKVRAISH